MPIHRISEDGGFRFGLEVEFLLVDASSFRPLWHPDLQFEALHALLAAIPVDGIPSLEGLDIEKPHRTRMPYVVEGYHLTDRDFNPVNLLPKGLEIRTPICASIDECLRTLRLLLHRLQRALTPRDYRVVAVSFHPYEHTFEGLQNKRRYDFWQWAMRSMVTYGPDVNVSLPSAQFARLDVADLHAKVNYYVPALTALTLASPLYRGEPWQVGERIGKSVRTYYRSVRAPALEVHPDQGGRLELKPFETPIDFEDFRGYFLLWLALLLDEGLGGRADDETRIYDLGAVARDGLAAETVADRAAEVLTRAPSALARWHFDPAPLKRFEERLATGRLPADAILAWYDRYRDLPAVLRHMEPH